MATVMQEELTRILETHGSVKPSILVEEARPLESPIHDSFEWDDTVAGKAYRLSQARRIIRVTKIVYLGVEDRLVHVPTIVLEPDGEDDTKEGDYRPIQMVVAVQSEFERALSELGKQLNAVTRSFNTLLDAWKENTRNEDAA